jgi:hypothetical protein
MRGCSSRPGRATSRSAASWTSRRTPRSKGTGPGGFANALAVASLDAAGDVDLFGAKVRAQGQDRQAGANAAAAGAFLTILAGSSVTVWGGGLQDRPGQLAAGRRTGGRRGGGDRRRGP